MQKLFVEKTFFPRLMWMDTFSIILPGHQKEFVAGLPFELKSKNLDHSPVVMITRVIEMTFGNLRIEDANTNGAASLYSLCKSVRESTPGIEKDGPLTIVEFSYCP